jgi:spore maturation protein CgeB
VNVETGCDFSEKAAVLMKLLSVVIIPRMLPQRLQVSPNLRGLMSYPKLRGPVPRVLILESKYWLDAACRRAATQLGWEIATTPVVLEGAFTRELIAQYLDKLVGFKPDFVLSINLSGMDVSGIFAGLFEDLAIPHVTWFVDDPRTIVMDSTRYSNQYSVALTWERGYVGYLKALGFAAVHWVPLAADDAVFHGKPGKGTHPPAFVGTAMVDSANLAWNELCQRPGLAKCCADAIDRGGVTRERFIEGIDAILGNDVLENVDTDGRRHAEMYLFIEGTRRLRHELVRILEPEGLVVYGSADWRGIALSYRRPVDYETELPAFYRECEVNVNTTSIQMPTVVNQRVFDCPAAGGFLLTDAQAALGELFDVESEVATYNSLDECVDKFRFYGKNPAERLRITTNAQARISHEHTYAHRLRHIVSIVQSLYG